MIAEIKEFSRNGTFNREDVFNNGYSKFSILRCCGFRRMKHYVWRKPGGQSNRYCCIHPGNHLGYCGCASHSLAALNLGSRSSDGIYVDFGCGNSPDAPIAAAAGFTALGVDLWPPDHVWKDQPECQWKSDFIKADFVSGIGTEDDFISYATCHAAIDLLTHEDRYTFYDNLLRAMVSGGLFALNVQNLAAGYGVDYRIEIERAQYVGFKLVTASAPGTTQIFTKT